MTVYIINPNSTHSMTTAMLAAARASAPHLDLAGWTSHDGPPAIQGRADGAAATSPLLALIDEAAGAGATGVIIGCFDDTALAEAQARVTCPVIGIGQAAYALAALRGWRFGVVTTLPVSVPILEENVARYGFGGFLSKVRASAIPVLDLEAAPETAAARILTEAQAAVSEDGAQAIVLGCAGMVQVTATLRARLDCPVIDPIEAAVGCISWLAATCAA